MHFLDSLCPLLASSNPMVGEGLSGGTSDLIQWVLRRRGERGCEESLTLCLYFPILHTFTKVPVMDLKTY